MERMLTVKDVQENLQIGRRQAYDLVQVKGFPKIILGEKTIRIPESAFEKWKERNIGRHIWY